MINNFKNWVKRFFITEDLDDFRNDLEPDELLVDEIDQYVLTQAPSSEIPGQFTYRVFDPDGILVGRYHSKSDAGSMKASDYENNAIKRIFVNVIKQEEKERKKQERKAQKKYNSKYDDDDWWLDSDRSYSSSRSNRSTSSRSSATRYSPYTYTPPPKSTGFLDKLNKSNTLVIHCEDRSTDMLSQVYEGKNWDVLRDGNIDKDELHQLLESHERIVMLGHGTSGGLINKQGGGYVIGDAEAPYLKDKELFVIWCNADRYFSNHGIGQGYVITGNAPSEVWECAAVGYHVSAPWILENITYWSKCMADVVELSFTDAEKAVKIAREEYQKSKTEDSTPDEIGVIDYNTATIKVQR